MPLTTADDPEVNPGDDGLSTTDAAPDESSRKRKSRACDRCHRNACRCSPGITGMPCRRCEKQSVECTYNRPVKRRGPPGRRNQTASDADPKPALNTSPVLIRPNVAAKDIAEPPIAAQSESSEASNSPGPNGETISIAPVLSDLYSPYEDIINPEEIENVIQAFHHTLYPILPYFHWPTFYSQICGQLYRSNWAIFVVTMSVSALTTAHLDDNIQMPPGLPRLQGIRSRAATISAQCYSAAAKAMPNDIASTRDYFDVMKACSILAAASLLKRDVNKAVAYLGDYTSLSVIHGFHSEVNWPVNLTDPEKEERRRLFWAVYQQEQYIAINFQLPPRQCEAKATVLYPTEVFDDEDIKPAAIQLRPDRTSFLCGWNYCTDLYRLFENVNRMIRAWEQASLQEPRGLLNSFLFGIRPSKYFTYEILNLISRLHQDLPQEAKAVNEITGNLQKDWYTSMAVNIILTTSHIKILLAGAEKPNVHLRCAIASELLDELDAIPSSALSTASLHHLSHIRHLLTHAIPGPLSNRAYILVRNIAAGLAEFIESADAAVFSGANIAVTLRNEIDDVDRYTQQGREKTSQTVLLPNNQPFLNTHVNDSDAAGASSRIAHDSLLTSITDISQTVSDPVFGPVSSTHHPSDLFKDWSRLSGETDSFDAVTAFLSIGGGTCDP